MHEPEVVVSPEVIEPEIVGHEPAAPFWRRLLIRTLLALILGALGLALTVLGAALTLTVIGAPAGIPILLVGLFLLVAAVLIPFLGGARRFHVFTLGGGRRFPS